MIFKKNDYYYFFREIKEGKKMCMHNVFFVRMNQIALFILHTRTNHAATKVEFSSDLALRNKIKLFPANI